MTEFGPVYFFVAPLGPPENTGYPHPLVALAEGLRELGVPFFSNRDAWRLSPDQDEFLFSHNPAVGPDDCAIVVTDNCWTYCFRELPPELLRPDRPYRTAFFDFEDADPSISTREPFRAFDLVFRPHWNVSVSYPSNFTPWAFGPTGRILRETVAAAPFDQRQRSILVSYRVDHPVRSIANTRFVEPLQSVVPVDFYTDDFAVPTDLYHRLQWHQTGRRHNPAYYRRLSDSQVCAAFGGTLGGPPLAGKLSVKGIVQRLHARMHRLPRFALQWDSFRLWESWSAGAATLHLDLQEYGAVLPEMPVNWQHYIGIDLDKPQAAIDRIRDDPAVLSRVAEAGRKWVLNHYHPRQVACRFLAMVSEIARKPAVARSANGAASPTFRHRRANAISEATSGG